MKDDQGSFIHIGETVTFTQAVRPRYLAGKYAKVISFGEKNIKVEIISQTIIINTKQVYVSPRSVRVGKHSITPYNIDDPRMLSVINTYASYCLAHKLPVMVEDGVVTAEQARKIIEYMEKAI